MKEHPLLLPETSEDDTPATFGAWLRRSIRAFGLGRRTNRVYWRFVVGVLGVVVSAVTLLHIIEFVLDPLYLRGAVPDHAPVPDDIRFAAPGLIRNLDYDALLVGSSITRGLPHEILARESGGAVLVMAMAGTSAFEQAQVAELALRERSLRRVFWEVTMLTFRGEPTRIKYVDFPAYLYDATPVNDLRYLLSPRGYLLLWKRIGAMFEGDDAPDVWTVARPPHPLRPVDADSVLEAACTALYYMTPRPFVPEEYSFEHFSANLRQNVLRLVDAHPDVEFVLFMPPLHTSFYTVLERVTPGFLDRYAAMKLALYAASLSRSNVVLVDFEDHFAVASDFSHYVDTQHHDAEVSAYIARHLLDDRHRVRRDQLPERLERFRARIRAEVSRIEPRLEAHCAADRAGLAFCSRAYRSFEAAMTALGEGRRDTALHGLARAVEIEDRGQAQLADPERRRCGFMTGARMVYRHLARTLPSHMEGKSIE